MIAEINEQNKIKQSTIDTTLAQVKNLNEQIEKAQANLAKTTKELDVIGLAKQKTMQDLEALHAAIPTKINEVRMPLESKIAELEKNVGALTNQIKNKGIS